MSSISEQYIKIDEIPFDFSRRRLSVVVQDKNNKKQLITKGAVEEILSICTMVDYRGTVSSLTKEIKENITKITKQLNRDGLRVVAVCQKNDITNISDFDIKDEKKYGSIRFYRIFRPT